MPAQTVLTQFLPFPASSRIHFVACCNPQGQDEGLIIMLMCTCAAGARLAVAWTGTVVCVHLVFSTVATTGPLFCVIGLLFCFSVDLLVYAQHQAGELLYVAQLLKVWEHYRPTQVNLQSQLSRRNVWVPLQ